MVPFQLHDNACDPVNPPTNGTPGNLTMGSDVAVLAFYGPVRAETSPRPFTVEFSSSVRPATADATEWFTGSVNGRTLTLSRPANQCLPKGLYTVRPVLSGSNRLLCDVSGLTGSASVPVANFAYRFNVVASGADCPCFYYPYDCPPCAADFDQNGGVDSNDSAEFFLHFEAGCSCADVDANGGVDGGDISAFYTLFEAGGC